MRNIDQIIIHCSDTPKGIYFDIESIRNWHINENGWMDVGYHYVILLNGEIQQGRPEKAVGAHCLGNNNRSIGICYIGGGDSEDTRTDEQKKALICLIKDLKKEYTDAKVYGHNDFSSKSCPNFNAKEEYKDL